MKKINYLWVLVVTVLLSLGACKQDEQMLLRYSLTDSASQLNDATLLDFVWKNGELQQVRKNNPLVSERPMFEDYAAFFNYALDYAYADRGLRALTGNKYRSEFFYENGNLARIDQLSQDGVLAYRLAFSYGDSNKVNVVLYSMSEEGIKWLESNLYPRTDSTGVRVQLEMPEDTAMHVRAESVFQWDNNNLVYAKTSFVDGSIVESRMEYDDKINPFYLTYCEFDKLDVLVVSLSFGFNNTGVSKNNLTKITAENRGGEGCAASEVVMEYTYEYDGDYPIVQRCSQNTSEYHYEYVK